MALVIFSQTTVITSGKVSNINHLRVKVGQGEWRNAHVDAALDDAVAALEAQGYHAHSVPEVWKGKGASGFATRIVRMTRLDVPARPTAPEPEAPQPEPKKARKPRKKSRNADQLEQQMA